MKQFAKYKNEAIIAVIILVLYLAGKDRYDAHQVTMRRIDKEEQEAVQLKTQVEDWERITVKYDDMSRALVFDDALSFKRFVDSKAQETGLSVTYVGPSREDKKFYELATMNLKISSPYSNVIDFLKLIEQNDIILDKITVQNKKHRTMGPKGYYDKTERVIEIIVKAYIKKSGNT